MVSNIQKIFTQYISDKIPKKVTNVFWLMFKGIQEMFEFLETELKTYKRERNILTANSYSSLRSLAAQNGFQPTLKIPTRGILRLKLSTKLFNRVGYPLYLPPYSIFRNKLNKLEYYYDANRILKITNDEVLIPVVEGSLFTTKYTSTGNHIEKYYIDNDTVADGSIQINSGNNSFVEVKSFFDNENINDNRQFIVKFSNKLDTPIVVYIKGTVFNEILDITYRLTNGELGNLDYRVDFETDGIINSNNDSIEIDETEIELYNVSGFGFGSDGTDISALRAAIGYNHGTNLLFDAISYSEFINKFSNIMLQQIIVSENNKAINNIYVNNKLFLDTNSSIKDNYQNSINTNKHLLTSSSIRELSKILDTNEYALSSHNLYNSSINKYSLQILFDKHIDQIKVQHDLETLIYSIFSKFLYDKYLVIDLSIVFNEFMKNNNVIFEYTLFNQETEQLKITNINNLNNANLVNQHSTYIIKHTNRLPILKGDFNIIDKDNNIIQLFFDINFVSKEQIN